MSYLDSEDSNNLKSVSGAAKQDYYKDPNLLSAPVRFRISPEDVEGFRMLNHFQHFYDSMDHPDMIREYATFQTDCRKYA